MSGLRVIFFGMEGLFSRAPLAALLAAGCPIGAVIVPSVAGERDGGRSVRRLAPPSGRPRGLPVLQREAERTIVGMAWEAGVPVFQVGSLKSSQALAAIAELRPDLLCVACFPYVVPRRLLDLAHYGALNVHPSLLPAYRGPSPLFWIFHDGLDRAGVTVHLMDDGLDSGDIVGQRVVSLDDGVAYSQAERLCSEEGGRLLVQAVQALAAGCGQRRPQDADMATAAPIPGNEDFVITPGWTARRAFNFIRGMAEGDQQITLQCAGETFAVGEALGFSDEQTHAQTLQRDGDLLLVPCSAGTLAVTLSARS